MDKVKVLFVCHGNICRSPMAQSIMQQLVDEAGIEDYFIIDSAATTNEEIGELMYPPARRKLVEKGVPALSHRARRIRPDEVSSWDYIIGMDAENLRHLQHILGRNSMMNVSTLLEHAGLQREIDDPWYTGDFETAYQDINLGCQALLAEIATEHGWDVIL